MSSNRTLHLQRHCKRLGLAGIGSVPPAAQNPPMKTPRFPELDSPRRKIIAAAHGAGWRFAAVRRRAARTLPVGVPAPRAAWLLFSDGRPALGLARQPHVARQPH